MKYTFLLALILSAQASAQTCVGPAPCDYAPEPVGPAELCLPEGCNPVSYETRGGFTLAFSFLPNSYPVMGWAGACDQPVCLDIKNQAFDNLLWNAKVANRAQRY